jgi:hypothetical protein
MQDLKGWEVCLVIGKIVLAVSAFFAVGYLLVFVFQILM